MNWSPKSAACPTGDCYVPLQADDPGSKFYQAKEALYEVLTNPSFPSAQLGFATYNQDTLGVRAKHWLYRATSNGPTITSWGSFPAIGDEQVFGFAWSCDTGNNDHDIGCTAAKPADLTDDWERTRMERLPKGGLTPTTTIVDYFVRHATVTYRVRYQGSLGTYGSNLTVTVSVLKCNNTACSSTTAQPGSPASVVFQPVDEFISWDNAPASLATDTPSRTAPELHYFSTVAADSSSGNTCAGWDPNTDTPADRSNSYSLRYLTDNTDPRGSTFFVGDVVPLDWNNNHKVDVLKRLAPNHGAGTPDFGISSYLANNRASGDSFLKLKSESQRPLLASGSTPLGASLASFRAWYNGCSGTGTCQGTSGWVGQASNPTTGDTSFRCRNKYMIILTDGDDTCPPPPPAGGNPNTCAYADRLRQEGVTIFVVAFGVTQDEGNPTNKLNCMADAAHTFYPQTKDELVRDLQKALGAISEDPRAFASAAVPSVQAEVADRIYLSSFRPVSDSQQADESPWAWDGHLDAYLKPLPLKNGKPDRDLACPAAASSRASCHLWDAGEVLLTQAPTASEVNGASSLSAGVLKLGLGAQQRRVFYPKAGSAGALPGTLRLFAPPAGSPKTDPEWSDLWQGLKLPTPVTNQDFTDTKTRIEKIMGNLLKIKEAEVQQTNEQPEQIRYILGDIFHADPVVVDRPNDFFFYSANLYGTKGLDSDCVNDPGYRCYSKQHRHRRKMLLVGVNDGQLHAIDAGVWNPSTQTFTEGTGTELFSYMPRLGLPIVRDQTEGDLQIFGIDGTPRLDDVHIDPRHNGIPTASQREWRTVAIGGFREGGGRDGGGRVADFVSGYYALDITQPDLLSTGGDPIDQRVVPSCISETNQASAGCGTLPFPSVLWEFTDSIESSQLDEDQNGFVDLGQTWSVPTVGRIKVVENSTVTDKFVAIFGGGMDAENKLSTKRGNWLYMVDIETGNVLYKRQLLGAVPSDPAALDVDLNGYLDTLYIGTLAGFLYKVDISSPGTMQDVTINTAQALPNLTASVQVNRITDASWEPFPIFNTTGKPIYLAPTALYVAKLQRFALTFGTGDREDLWHSNTASSSTSCGATTPRPRPSRCSRATSRIFAACSSPTVRPAPPPGC